MLRYYHPRLAAGIAIVILAVPVCVTRQPAWGADPVISGVSPQGLLPGATTDITVSGSNLSGATELWLSFPANVTLAPDVENNGSRGDRVVFRVETPDNAPVGIHGMRLVAKGGVSRMRLVCVDDLPSVPTTSNSSPGAAQAVTPPVAVDGQMTSLGRDYYRFSAAAGQRLTFEVVARRLGSALDPMIRILTSDGREMTYNDDAAALNSDARLCHRFEAAGDYLLEVRDIRYQGGGNYHYRLRIGDFPCVTSPFPMGVKAGQTASVRFAGEDLDGVDPVAITLTEKPLSGAISLAARRDGGQSAFATLKVDSHEEFVEVEGNDTPRNANRLPLGSNINGMLDRNGDVDHFVFPARKGDHYVFRGVTRQFGSPTDLRLRLSNRKGEAVADAEDSGTTEGILTYRFPDDGDYVLTVEDLHGRGGAQFAYRIDVSPFQAGFRIHASPESVSVPRGGTETINVTAERDGYDGVIEITMEGLPEGVTATPSVIGSGADSVVLTLQASPEATPVASFSARVLGTAKGTGEEVRRSASLLRALRSSLNELPWPPAALTLDMAVAVAPPPPVTLASDTPELIFGPHLSATVRVSAARTENADEEITLAMLPSEGGLPPGVTVAVKPIEKGKNEVDIVFSASDKAPLGDFTAVLIGKHTKDKQTTTQAVPGLRLKLQAPFTASFEPAMVSLVPGGTKELTLHVNRNPAFAEPIEFTFENLPKGVAAEKVTIAGDQSSATIMLTAAADAAVGMVEDVSASGVATIGKNKVTERSAALSLNVAK